MKLTKILTPVLACAFLCSMSTDLTAQRGGKRIEAMFKKLDTNQDGKVTQAEAGERWKRLGKADADKDGAVTLDELKASMKNRRGKRGKKKRGGK